MGVNRVSLTTLVDVNLEKGTVDSSRLNAELPKFLEQAIARLPGVSAALSPDIKINPKFNITKISDQLGKLLQDPKFQGLEQTKGYEQLTQSVTKYVRALEHISRLQTTVGNDKQLSKIIDQWQKGQIAFSAIPEKMQGKVLAFGKQWEEIQKVVNQVVKEFTKINDLAYTPAQESQRNALKQSISQTTQEIARLKKELKSLGDDSKDAGAVFSQLQSKIELRADTKKQLSEIGKTQLGALADPGVLRLQEVANQFAGIRKAAQAELAAGKKTAAQQSADEQKALENRVKQYQAFADKKRASEAALLKANMEAAALRDKELETKRQNFIKARKNLELNRIKEETKAALDATKAQEEAIHQVRLTKGLQTIEQYHSVNATPRELLEDRGYALKHELNRSLLERDAIAASTGRAGPEYEKAAAAAAHLKTQLLETNRAIRDGNTPWKQFTGLLSQFTRYAVGYGALYKITQGITELIKAAIDLEDKLKTIQAISGGTNSELTKVEETIKGIAKSTAFDFNDIADAVKLLIQAGVPLNKINSTAQAVANLATATGTTLTVAADVMTTAQEIWDNVDIATIGDRIAQAANVSKLAVEDLQTILNLEGSAAANANLTLEQNLAAIATARNAGLKPSTIATGMTELLAEILSPDKKFSNFLSQQYRKIGEDVNPQQAAKRFAQFRFEADPLLSALAELKRIQVDSAESAIRLERAVDRRALRPLTVLLQDLNKLPEIQSRLVTAQTSQEAARIALDSLKKSTANLGDALKALSSTILSGGVLNALQSFTSSLTNMVSKMDTWVQRAQKNDSISASFALPGLIGTGVGALAARGGVSTWSKVLRFLGAGAAAGSTTYAANNVAEDQGVTDEVVTGINFSILAATIVSKLKALITKALAKTAVVEAEAVAAAEAGGTLALVTTWFKGVFSKLKLSTVSAFAAIANPYVWVPAAVVGLTTVFQKEILAYFKAIAIQAKSIWNLSPKSLIESYREALTGDTSSQPFAPTDKTIDETFQDQARNRQRAEEELQAYSDYLKPVPGKPTGENNVFALRQKVDDEIKKVRDGVSEAIGAQLNESTDQIMLDTLQAFKETAPGSKTAREQLNAELKTKLNGTKDASDEFLERITLDATGTASLIKGLTDTLKVKHQQLYSGPQNEATSQQLAALEELKKHDQLVAAFFSGRVLNIADSIKVYERVTGEWSKLAESKKADLESKGFSDINDLREQVRATLSSSKYDYNITALTSNLNKTVQEQGLGYINKAFESITSVFGEAFSSTGPEAANPDLRKKAAQLEKSTTQALGDSAYTLLSKDTEDLTRIIDQVNQFGEGVDKDTRQRLADLQEMTKITADQIRTTGLDKGNLENIRVLNNEINRDIEAKGLRRTQEGRLQLGSVFDSLIRQAKASEPTPEEYKGFYGSEETFKLESDLERLKSRKDSLSSAAGGIENIKNLEELAKSGILEQEQELIRRRKEIELAYEQSQPAPIEERDRLEWQKRIATLQSEIQKTYEDAKNNVKEANDRLTKALNQKLIKENTLEISKLGQELSGLQSERNLTEQTGDVQKVLELNAKIKGVKEKQYALENKNLELQYEGTDLAAQVLVQQQKQKEELLALQGLDSLIKTTQANLQLAQESPAAGRTVDAFYGRAKLLASGQAISVADRVTQVTNVQDAAAGHLKYFQDAGNQLENNLAAMQKAYQATGDKALLPQIKETQTELQKVNIAALGFADTLGKVRQELEDLNATPLTEFNQISAESIGSKISDLPGSMRNLNTNIENRFVGAADSIANVMANGVDSVVSSLLGLGKEASQTSNELRALREAQAGYADIVSTGSLDIAAQIESIKRNESDPLRQEYLINRALEAQRQAEDIAKAQVDEAQRQYDYAKDQNSIGGQLKAVGADFFGGIGSDMAKAGVLDIFKNLFGLGGKRGESKSNPIYTEEVSGGIAGAIAGKGGSGLSSIFGKDTSIGKIIYGIGDTFGNAWDSLSSGVSNLFSSNSTGSMFTQIGNWAGDAWKSFAGTSSAAVQGASAASAAGDAASAAGSASSSMGAIGGIVGGLASIAGTLTAYFASQDQEAPTYTQGSSALTGGSNGIYYGKAGLTKSALAAWRSRQTAPMKGAKGKAMQTTKAAVSGVQAPPTAASEVQGTTQQNIRMVLVDDQRRVADFINSPQGDKVIVNALKRNQLSARQALQG